MEPNARFHALSERAIWAERASPKARGKLLLRIIAWPFVAALLGLQSALRQGRAIGEPRSVGLLRQYAQSYVLALRAGCPPSSYYKFGLYSDPGRKAAGAFVHHHEAIHILPVINGGQVRWDKRWFADQCERHGLPHVSAIMSLPGAGVSSADIARQLPHGDIFIKPADGFCGRGAACWRWTVAAYESRDGRKLTAEGLAEHLYDLAQHAPLLVQPVLRTHPDLTDLSGEALSTVRIVTGLSRPATTPVIVGAAFKMAGSGECVDNFAAGGLAAPVDIANGRLGMARRKDPTFPPAADHPQTGSKIVGRILPLWNDAVALCLLAHRRFDDVAFVGWDVAITAEGPILVEGNPTFCVELMQMTSRIPLLDTSFRAIALSRLEGNAGVPAAI
jgi:hypothetical protein